MYLFIYLGDVNLQLKLRKKISKKKCINLFNPGQDIYQDTFPDDLVLELSEIVDYWRPEGEIDRLITTDYFFRELLQEAEILITGWGTPKLPFDLLYHGHLEYICHVTGSIRHCIAKDFLEKGRQVTNWGDSISGSIAEAALMLILTCLRRLGYYRKLLEAGEWDRQIHPPLSLAGQRIGLFGFGNIAQQLVRFLKPFKAHIQAYDPYTGNDAFLRLKVERVKDLKKLFSENDIISLHAGSTDELVGVVNRDLLCLMPDKGILINTAQGKLINEDDLLDELKKGRLWCGLDVFNEEPLPPHSLFRYLPCCVVTPHIAGPPRNCYRNMGEYAVKNINRFIRGEPLMSKISVEQYDRMT